MNSLIKEAVNSSEVKGGLILSRAADKALRRGDLDPVTQHDPHLDAFYDYFDDGWIFESFLQLLLVEIGLDDVEVTQRSRDGGIDLTAVRRGVEGLSALDEVHYCVQAKRLKPGTAVNVRDVRALRGVMPSGSKGIFITTGRYTRTAHQFAEDDPARPLVLIDGPALTALCIEHRLGFVPHPVFDPRRLDELLGRDAASQAPAIQDEVIEVSKLITANDIRARILSIPSAIACHMPDAKTTLTLHVMPGEQTTEVTWSPGRKYLGGVTGILRDHGLLQGTESQPAPGVWRYAPSTGRLALRIASLLR